MTATTKLALELLQNNAANQTLANTTFAQLNQLVQAGVVDRTNTPPGSPANEALYIVTATATGAWVGKENQLAYWLTSTNAWQFIVAREGFLVHVNDEDTFYKFDGSSWAVFSSGGGSFTGGTLSTALNEAPPATVASASTTNIGAADRNTVNITGTTTITAFDTIASGAIRRLVFGGALTLTHNATSLILPTGANLTTAAGDVAEFLSLGSGNWRCVDYTRANGQALAGSAVNTTQTVTSSGGVLNLSTTTTETLLLTTSENVTSISWPSGVAGQSIQRRLVVTQGGAGNYTLPSTTANWGGITVDGGLAIPQPVTGLGSSTTYVLVNDNNTGWRMYIDKGPLASFRNKLINANFQINIRAVSGTVVLAAGQYGHDRWKAGASGCTYTFTTSAGITTITITAGSLQQVISGDNLQSGTHTLSWSGTAQGKIGAGSYSASGVTGSVTGGANTTIEFNTGTLSLPQFEPGTAPTTFEHRLREIELILCEWYAKLITGHGAFYSSTGVSVYAYYGQMRATPAFSTLSGGSTIAGIVAGTGPATLLSVTFATPGPGLASINGTSSVSAAIGTPFRINEFVLASAEL